MKVLNFGSLNYDYVYSVDHIVIPGETAPAFKMQTFCGGKGLNQSIALARAGVNVWHAGIVGEDGNLLLDMCTNNQINVSNVKQMTGKSGHTVIQVDSNGQNSIILFGGANRSFTTDFIDEVFTCIESNDLILIQNEINHIDYIIEQAYKKEIKIVFNPSPFDDNILKCNLAKISVLMINEIEGQQITGMSDINDILKYFKDNYPNTAVVLTLGKDGSIYQLNDKLFKQGIYKTKVVDTTAAGDTFTGYFLASVISGKDIPGALKLASKASAITVSRNGAAPSIPSLNEVLSFDL